MFFNLLKEKSVLIVLVFIICSIPSLAHADAEKIFKENSKSVVVVVTFDDKGEPQSQGSGFIVRSDGAVVTNYHVVSNASDIKLKAGNKILDVEGIVHEDKENDIVILKAKGKNLRITRSSLVVIANQIVPSVIGPVLVAKSIAEVVNHVVNHIAGADLDTRIPTGVMCEKIVVHRNPPPFRSIY